MCYDRESLEYRIGIQKRTLNKNSFTEKNDIWKKSNGPSGEEERIVFPANSDKMAETRKIMENLLKDFIVLNHTAEKQ